MTGRERYISMVRSVGESIVKNTESIVGTEKYMSGIDINIHLDLGEIPQIDVRRSFYPERYVDEYNVSSSKTEEIKINPEDITYEVK